jgi:hypothetical protein
MFGVTEEMFGIQIRDGEEMKDYDGLGFAALNSEPGTPSS